MFGGLAKFRGSMTRRVWVVWKYTYIHTYLHAHLHAYIPTYVRTCVCTYVRTCLRAFVPTCVRAYVHTWISAHVHTYIHTCIRSELYRWGFLCLSPLRHFRLLQYLWNFSLLNIFRGLSRWPCQTPAKSSPLFSEDWSVFRVGQSSPSFWRLVSLFVSRPSYPYVQIKEFCS